MLFIIMNYKKNINKKTLHVFQENLWKNKIITEFKQKFILCNREL